MKGLNESNVEIIGVYRAAGIGGFGFFRTLLAEMAGDLEDGDQRGAGRFADRHRVADMIVVAVGERHVGRSSRCFFHVAFEDRASRKKRIDDQHGFAGLDAKGRLTEPGDFHGLSPTASTMLQKRRPDQVRT